METPGTAAVSDAASDLQGLFDLDGRLRAVADPTQVDSPYQVVITPEREEALRTIAQELRRIKDRLNQAIHA